MRKLFHSYVAIFLTIVLITACHPLKKKNAAANFNLYKKALFVEQGDSLPYRILFPKNYDHKKKYPLVVFLHGSGERGNDNVKQLTHGASLFLKPKNRKKYPCFVVFPQCPTEKSWAAYKLDKSKTPPERTFDYKSEPTSGMHLTNELIQKLIKSESLDDRRIYISGLSMGGFGTFEAVDRYPGLFAAAAPICGGGNVQEYDETTAKTPFWIFHGDIDQAVPVQHSRDMYARLLALHGDVLYTEYPGVGHNSWENAFAEPDFLKWLFSKKK